MPSLDKVKKILVGNWKMYLGYKASLSLAEELENKINYVADNLKLVICPSFPALPAISPLLKDLRLGVQDLSFAESGAYTGQVSAKELKEIGTEFAILGHSERRKYFKETNEMICDKVKQALGAGLIPIVCVGENSEDREKGLSKETVSGQLYGSLKGIELNAGYSIVIAYEPVWAIGSKKPCSPELAVEMNQFIKVCLKEIFSDYVVRNRFKFLYGGSVDSSNFMSYVESPEIDGVLVGGASVKADEFIIMAERIKKFVFELEN